MSPSDQRRLERRRRERLVERLKDAEGELATREAHSGDPYLLRKAREMNRALDCEPDEWIWEEYPHESA